VSCVGLLADAKRLAGYCVSTAVRLTSTPPPIQLLDRTNFVPLGSEADSSAAPEAALPMSSQSVLKKYRCPPISSGT
jgi:hypothetical protein